MIELGKIQKLIVTRKTQHGVYLNKTMHPGEDDVLLPQNQVQPQIEIGDEVEVFVYKDSEDRIISTIKKPKVTVGGLTVLRVIAITNIGAFLDWGLDKDLFLPFREQVGEIKEDGTYLVGLYIDRSNRLSATMNVYPLLSNQSPYKKNDRVNGTIYKIVKEMGAFVAVENKYHGMIPKKELIGNYAEGDHVSIRIKQVRQDGKLELSLRNEAYKEIEEDAKIIMNKLELCGGFLRINDKSDPAYINSELSMSKAAFKRAVGRLLKEGAIKITENGIERLW